MQLIENTKIVRLTAAEQRQSIVHRDIRHEPTGRFELRLKLDLSYHTDAVWKDGTRKGQIEDQLNAVMIEMLVGVESQRDWRIARAKQERRVRRAQARHWRKEELRRIEQAKIDRLYKKAESWALAEQIRDFLAAWRAHIEQREGPLQEGSKAY